MSSTSIRGLLLPCMLDDNCSSRGDTMRRGADEGGLPGFVRGAARGAAGVLIRPLAAGLETSMRVADSIRSAVTGAPPLLPRLRPPRYVPTDAPLQPYSWSEVSALRTAHLPVITLCMQACLTSCTVG